MTTTKRQDRTLIGVGVAACAACCAGPIIGFLAAIGLGAAAGFALFGGVAVIVGAMATAVVLRLRRRRADDCATPSTPVAIESPGVRTAR